MSLLRFESVTRAFDGPQGERRVVLDRVDLTLDRGQVMALTGRSGAGKTTLLHLAAGLIRPGSGRVWFDGLDLGLCPPAQTARLRRRRIGLIFQNSLALGALPIWENAALGLLMEGARRTDARRAALAMLERVGLDGAADRSLKVLSGGQRRRLGLARCLLGDPDLMLADEPTADLDEATASRIEGIMLGWLRERNRTAIIVTHAPSIERAADRVERLEEGRLGNDSVGPPGFEPGTNRL